MTVGAQVKGTPVLGTRALTASFVGRCRATSRLHYALQTRWVHSSLRRVDFISEKHRSCRSTDGQRGRLDTDHCSVLAQARRRFERLSLKRQRFLETHMIRNRLYSVLAGLSYSLSNVAASPNANCCRRRPL